MNKKDVQDFFKKAFSKTDRNERYHSIAMLMIYLFFFAILVAFVRIGGNNKPVENNNQPTNTPVSTPTATPVPTPAPSNNANTDIVGDVNYSYSYTINYDGVQEVYLGKRIDDKQKFTYQSNGVTYEYAILDGNYLKLDNGKYHIINKLDTYFKYCDADKILNIIEKQPVTKVDNINRFNVANSIIAKAYKETLADDNVLGNTIDLLIEGQSIKSINMDFSNYISSVLGENHTLTITIEYANVGTTENFEIKIN